MISGHAYRANGLGARDQNGNVPCAQCGLTQNVHTDTGAASAGHETPGRLRLGERNAVLHDLGMLLEALGLGDYARPESPHDVMMACVAEAARLKKIERDLLRLAQ